MNTIVDILIPLGFFAMAFGIVFVSVNAHHKSKMAMIAAGIDPRDPEERGERKDPGRLIKYVFLLILVPIGILVGRAAHEGLGLSPKHASLIFAFIFGGIALGLTFLIEQMRDKKNDELS